MFARAVALRVFFVFVIMSVVATSGCRQSAQAGADGERLDQAFHIVMSQGTMDQIYAATDPVYRAAVSSEKSAALFTAIRKKLGDPMSCQQLSWRLNTTTSGTYLTSVTKTEFTKQAEGQETFVWKRTENGYKLAGYSLNSNDLITR